MTADKKLDNFLLGTAVFAAIALILGCFLPFYVGARTSDKTMKRANQWMACGLSWLGVFYMWLAWSVFFQAQLYPYLTIMPTIEVGASD